MYHPAPCSWFYFFIAAYFTLPMPLCLGWLILFVSIKWQIQNTHQLSSIHPSLHCVYCLFMFPSFLIERSFCSVIHSARIGSSFIVHSS